MPVAWPITKIGHYCALLDNPIWVLEQMDKYMQCEYVGLVMPLLVSLRCFNLIKYYFKIGQHVVLLGLHRTA